MAWNGLVTTALPLAAHSSVLFRRTSQSHCNVRAEGYFRFVQFPCNGKRKESVLAGIVHIYIYIPHGLPCYDDWVDWVLDGQQGKSFGESQSCRVNMVLKNLNKQEKKKRGWTCTPTHAHISAHRHTPTYTKPQVKMLGLFAFIFCPLGKCNVSQLHHQVCTALQPCLISRLNIHDWRFKYAWIR